MKRKMICLLLVMAMGVLLFAGCKGNKISEAVPDSDNSATDKQDIVIEDAPQETEPSRGIQTVELMLWDADNTLQISYDADVLFCEGAPEYLFFYDDYGEIYFDVMIGDDAYSNIERCKTYDWMENYSASPVQEQYINGMLVQSYTESYTRDGNFRENTIYSIPIGGGMALSIQGEMGDGSILEKAFISIEGNIYKPFSENDFVILKDPAGNEVYKIALAPWAYDIQVTSNENGRVTFEYTAEMEDGTLLTCPAEISVNAYGSGEEFFNAISGKYWTVYSPFEDELYGEKYVSTLGFWDQKVNGNIEQYQDLIFYFEMADGNLITGICDSNQASFVSACFEQGFNPVQ